MQNIEQKANVNLKLTKLTKVKRSETQKLSFN